MRVNKYYWVNLGSGVSRKESLKGKETNRHMLFMESPFFLVCHTTRVIYQSFSTDYRRSSSFALLITQPLDSQPQGKSVVRYFCSLIYVSISFPYSCDYTIPLLKTDFRSLTGPVKTLLRTLLPLNHLKYDCSSYNLLIATTPFPLPSLLPPYNSKIRDNPWSNS